MITVRADEIGRVMPIPDGLVASGTRGSPFEPVATLGDVTSGSMIRVSRGDLDILVVCTPVGIAAIDDRCPHMAAPLSLGSLDGCVIACPLHSASFDLSTGELVSFPLTGGLDPDGVQIPPWAPAGATVRPPATDLKASVRAQTRIRRMRYYPLRIRGEAIEIAFPHA